MTIDVHAHCLPAGPGDTLASDGGHDGIGIGSLGMVGVEIATTLDGGELDEPSLALFWDAGQLRCLALVHPHQSLKVRNVARYFLENLDARLVAAVRR